MKHAHRTSESTQIHHEHPTSAIELYSQEHPRYSSELRAKEHAAAFRNIYEKRGLPITFSEIGAARKYGFAVSRGSAGWEARIDPEQRRRDTYDGQGFGDPNDPEARG